MKRANFYRFFPLIYVLIGCLGPIFLADKSKSETMPENESDLPQKRPRTDPDTNTFETDQRTKTKMGNGNEKSSSPVSAEYRTSTWTIVRHGQTNCNIKGIIQGQSIPAVLAKNGRDQAAKLGSFLRKADEKYDTVYCSDLIRAKETALGLLGSYFDEDNFDQFDHPPSKLDQELTREDCTRQPSNDYIQFLEDKADKVGKDFSLKIGFTDKLREKNFGVKEGSNRSDFKMLSAREPLPEGAESNKQVKARVRAFISDVFKSLKNGDSGGNSSIMVVSHGGTIKCFVEELIRLFEFREGCQALSAEKLGIAPNTSRTVVKFHYKFGQQVADGGEAKPLEKTNNPLLPLEISDVRLEVIKLYDVEHLEQ